MSPFLHLVSMRSSFWASYRLRPSCSCSCREYTTGGTSRTLSTSSSDRGTYHSVALLVSFVTPSEERSTCVMTKAEAEDRATGDPAGGEALGL